MTTQHEERNPFPEPQTIPSGWDMSALLSTPKADSASDTESSADGDAS